MNNLNTKLAALAATLAIAATAAWAQTIDLNVSVPFAFSVGKQNMPAGDYTIPMSGGNTVLVKNVNYQRGSFASAIPLVTKANETPRLIFECRAAHCALRQIRAAGVQGYEFPAKWEKSEANELARVVILSVKLSNAN